MFFNGVVGNDIYNNLANVMDNLSLFSKGFNTTVNATKSPEAFDNVLDYSSRYIEDGSYLRLSSATLGYNVPLKSNKWVSNVRLTLTGNNLFVLTGYSGYDPEVNIATGLTPNIDNDRYPRSRTYTFGAQLTF